MSECQAMWLRKAEAERDQAIRERDAAQRQWESWKTLADLSRKRIEKAEGETDQARAVARRLYHDWNARTVRSLKEIAEENPWILEQQDHQP